MNRCPTEPLKIGVAKSVAPQSGESPIRVTVVQPSLAKYRIAVYRELARRPGIDLQVVYGTSQGIPNVPPDGFRSKPCARWEGRIAGNLLMFQGAEWSYCSRRSADVVLLRWTGRSLTLLPALLRARASSVGTVLWGHGYSKKDRGWWQGGRNLLARQASALVFYDHRTRDTYRRCGWDPDKLYVAANSIEHTEIDAARQWWLDHPDELTRFRQEHEIDLGPVILFVSRLQPANRVDLLIRATAELVRGIPTLKTVIIGTGQPERARLEELAAGIGVTGNVVFQEGIYDEMKLAPWFLSAAVFGYPSNIGLSLLHAMWYALPVVTSDQPTDHGPEFVALEHGVNGLTYEHGSVASLANALQELLTNDGLRRSMSQAARRTVEDRFTIAKMVDELEAAIRYAADACSTKLRNHC